VRCASGDEYPCACVNGRTVNVQLDRQFACQKVNDFIAGVVDVQRRSGADRHRLFKDRNAASGLLGEQFESHWPLVAVLHLPD